MGALQSASDLHFYRCTEAVRIAEGGGEVEAGDERHKLTG